MHSGCHWQRGSALLVVMVMVLLAGLLLGGTLRTAWFNELVVGTEADYQRAFDNAQALLRDAELDIQDRTVAGGPCREGTESDGSCRRRGAAAFDEGEVRFPQNGPAEFEPLRDRLLAGAPSCERGICTPEHVAAEFWQTPKGELDKMKAVAARYGEFTGAALLPSTNPLLGAKGWYWVEVLPFDLAAPLPAGAEALQPDAGNPYIYRITAIAEGRKPATRAVLQSLFVQARTISLDGNEEAPRKSPGVTAKRAAWSQLQ